MKGKFMLFAVHCLDHADGLPRRQANYDAIKRTSPQAR